MVRSRHPNRRRSGRLGARVRSRTERGERGDREDVLTKGGDGVRRPESGRRRTVDRRPHTGGQVRQRRVRHGRQHGWRVLGTWCQEVGRQAVEVVPHEDEQRQQGRSARSSLLLTSIVQKTAHWQSFSLRNKMLNGKTESKRRDERDGVLTFGQG
jgi:hypothetical protein